MPFTPFHFGPGAAFHSLAPKRISFLALGAWSHIVFDSIMHADMRPLAPFSDVKALYGLVSIEVLQWGCVGAAVMGGVVVAWRRAHAPTPTLPREGREE